MQEHTLGFVYNAEKLDYYIDNEISSRFNRGYRCTSHSVSPYIERAGTYIVSFIWEKITT